MLEYINFKTEETEKKPLLNSFAKKYLALDLLYTNVPK